MRERLFRGKRVDNGEWIVGGFLQDDDGKTYIVGYEHRGGIDGMIDAELILWEVIPETVGQYIELPDKNGKKIFEGDIVRDAETSEVGKIFFDKYTAMFVIGFENTIADFNASYSLEVIGNIYDNPELIGGEANE